ncbi:hypothetical protein PCASD_15080 [Puccinia coronata f. sp. avenae]|uniref:Uncharacterized protein n=1 Tax=Puccinia coronata f. sp. avenae TaxID=200324 RepID=A0A2N5T6A0_9BASI|nr:hypothetical protein PCASD_15080 [Puccinia coronata f. sp. avenae]
MSEPATAPSESTKSTKEVPESLRQQRGLVNESFKNLAKKFEEYTIWNWSNPISSVDLTCNIEAVNELENKILPLLCQQLNTIQIAGPI